MIPTFSEASFTRPWEFPTRTKMGDLVDVDRGGGVLGEAFGPPPWHSWTARYTTLGTVELTKDDEEAPKLVIPIPNVTRLAFTFDQNMGAVFAYESGRSGYLRREVPGVGVVTTPLGNVSNVCLTLDDSRPEGIPESDVILGYMRDGNLYCRVQRENYSERLLKTSPQGTLRVLGVCSGPRLQWRLA